MKDKNESENERKLRFGGNDDDKSYKNKKKV
jgi:hypothetical protein